MPFVVIYDACVLYPAHMRDCLQPSGRCKFIMNGFETWSQTVLN